MKKVAALRMLICLFVLAVLGSTAIAKPIISPAILPNISPTISPASPATSPTILVVGDSLSAAYGMSLDDGWVALLQGRLDKLGLNYTVVNASISGDITASGADRIARLLREFQPTWTLIELGANDGLRGLPVKHVQENLASMITQSTAAGSKVVLAGMQVLPNYGPKYATAFKNIYRDLSPDKPISAKQVFLVPFILEGVGGLPHMNQADGIHPTKAAQPLLLDNVWAILGPLLRQ